MPDCSSTCSSVSSPCSYVNASRCPSVSTHGTRLRLKEDNVDEKAIQAAAEAAYEANCIFCAAIGDASQVPWNEAPLWQRSSMIEGVRVALAGATPEQQHDAWCVSKYRDGWTCGPTKDADAKTHPCLMPYAALPPEQRAKDSLYGAVVRGMVAALGEASGG